MFAPLLAAPVRIGGRFPGGGPPRRNTGIRIVSKTKAESNPTPPKGGKSKPPAKTPDKSEEDAELDGLMTEIEEDLREEEFKKFWAKHGSKVIAALAMIVVAVLGWQFWRQTVEDDRRALAKSYDQAVRLAVDGKAEDAITAFATVAGSRGEGFAILAQLQKAALLAEKKDIAGALAAYTALADDSSADPLFRDLATILYAMRAIDTEAPEVVENRLQPLMSPSNPFYSSAAELAALLASRRGDMARAISLIEPLISDPNAPGGVRSRAEELSAMFKAMPAGGVAPAPASAPAVPPEPSAPPQPSAAPAQPPSSPQ